MFPQRSTRSLLRLCHLVSPALPVGAYSYSQGLECAVQRGWIVDEGSALAWLQGLSGRALGTLDLPILKRLYVGCSVGDEIGVRDWNQRLIAARETAELRAEDLHLGLALARILVQLNVAGAQAWLETQASFATVFSLAAVRWRIALEDTLAGYLWTWTENQVLAAVKLVPLGQSAGQRLLNCLIEAMPEIVARADALPDERIGVGTVGAVLASALHETQYTRLFRS